jgi:parallel beta-helix repeat protein
MKRIVSATLVLLLFANSLLFSLNIIPVVAEGGLVGHWKFDEGSGATAYDSSGYAHDGTIYGASWVPGKNGTALGFDGVEDRVEVEHDANLDPGTEGFTLTAWVKPSIVMEFPDHQRIVWKNSGSPMLNGYYLSLVGSSFIFGVGDGSSKAEPMGGEAEAGVWYFVVGVRDRVSGRAVVYLNGVQVDERTDASGDIDYTGKLLFGGRNDYSVEFFNGRIDDVRIYSRTLATNELLELYQAGKCVHNLNTGSSFPTIQEAIDAANAGDTILADSGTYYENVVVNKSLSLIGENEYTTIIDGNQTGNVVVVTANAVNITGFTIRNSSGATDTACVALGNCTNILVEDISAIGNNGVGIGLWATSNSTIRNVTASGGIGIALQLSNGNVLENNSVTGGFQAAILLQNSGNNTLRDNRMGRFGFAVISGGPWVWLPGLINDVDASNTVCGKPIYYWIDQHNKTVPSDGGLVLLVNCSGMTVRDLNISSNLVGVALYQTTDSVIEDVSVTECANGIALVGSNNTLINDCFVTDGVYWSTGMFLHTSSNNTLTGNTISNMVNQQQPGQPPMGAGIAIFMGRGNRIYHNNFVNDTVSSSVSYSIENVFDNGYVQNGFGNYWSDYSGDDLFWGAYQNMTGEDRIGDTPYVLDANNKDNYPLMLPWTSRFALYDCAFLVVGSSMSPTILARDWIWVKNTTDPSEITPGSYPFGDVVVHKKPGDPSVYIVRRVTAKWFENDTWYFTVKSDGGSQEGTTIPLSLLVGKVVALLRPFHIDYKGRTLTAYVYSNSTLDGFSFDADAKCISYNTTGMLIQGDMSYCDVFIPSVLLRGLNEIRIGDTTIPLAYQDYGRYLIVSFSVNQTEYSASIYGYTVGTSPDLSMIDIAPSKTVIGEGYTGSVSGRVENQGDFPETINVTLYANSTIVKTLTLTVQYKSLLDVSFIWNTTGFARGSYELKAVAEPVAGETDTTDNTFVDGWVFVSIPGDVIGPAGIPGVPDKKVDLRDVYAVGRAFGAVIGDPRYNPNLDINGDGKIDLKDYFMTCKNYGKSW